MDRMGEIEEPLRFLRLSLILLVPIAIAIAALGGYWMAGRALAPVDRITKQAQAIEAQNLASRIPHPGPDDELGRLVDTLNQMFGRLEHAFEGMKRFTSDASHELRSPLAIMRSTIDVALSHPRSRDEYRASLESLGEEVDRLRRVSSDLLLLARADAGRLELDVAPVHLGRLVKEVIEAFQPVATHKSIRLEGACDQAPIILGDERWLRQVLANLLDNALKFTPSGGHVHVELQTEGSEVQVGVEDTGPGIPAEQLPRIFERFYQGDSARTRSDKQGTGLGLAISAWIVEAHGGTLTAVNRSDASGCRMTMRLPCPT
jgi:heavy metal sensor kinase